MTKDLKRVVTIIRTMIAEISHAKKAGSHSWIGAGKLDAKREILDECLRRVAGKP